MPRCCVDSRIGCCTCRKTGAARSDGVRLPGPLDAQLAPKHKHHQGKKDAMHQPYPQAEAQLARIYPAARQIDQIHIEQPHQACDEKIAGTPQTRSEAHTSELQSLMLIQYAV